MLVIAVIIAGVIGFFAELVFRMLFQGGLRWGGGRSSGGDRGKGGGGIAIVIAIALIAVAWLLSVVIRFALSRRREFLADAGSVELTKNPDAMIIGAAQDRGPRRARRRDLGGHGNVRRQPARGLRRPVRHPSVDRQPGRGAGPVRRRPRSRPARRCRSPEEAKPSRTGRSRTGAPATPSRQSRSCRPSRRSRSASGSARSRPPDPRPLGTAARQLIAAENFASGR